MGSRQPDEIVIPTPALVVLVGASSSGKSTWAGEQFKPGQILSADTFRSYYGAGPDDQTVGTEAFAMLDHLIEARLAKGLTTVVDTLGLDAKKRADYRDKAAAAGVPCVAVGFDTATKICEERNQTRPYPLPKTVLGKQLRQWRSVRGTLADEGFDHVHINPGQSRQVPRGLTNTSSASKSDAAAAPTDTTPRTGLTFDLVVSRFEFDDADMATTLTDIANAAEQTGFGTLWVMDHFRQVPQVGRAWEPMLEAYTTLAYLAARTTTIRLGTLVTGVEHRNVGLLAKIIATLDVLSNGRAECGLGAGWFSAEQAAFGYPVNSDKIRLDTLEDALQALPILWSPGAKSFSGKTLSIPEALAYPRPAQDPIPILVGGGGEKRTLRLAAQYADTCNVIGTNPETVANKIAVVTGHCQDLDRDPESLTVSTLNPLIHATSGKELSQLIESMRPANRSAESFAADHNAATTDEHVAYFANLAQLGVGRVCVALTGNTGRQRVEAFGQVIEAFA